MPQLDKVTFLSQFFWMTFTFLAFYSFLLKRALPKISRILKYREKKIVSIPSETLPPLIAEEMKAVSLICNTVVSKAVDVTVIGFKEVFDLFRGWVDSTCHQTEKVYLQHPENQSLFRLGNLASSQNLEIDQPYKIVSKKGRVLFSEGALMRSS